MCKISHQFLTRHLGIVQIAGVCGNISPSKEQSQASGYACNLPNSCAISGRNPPSHSDVHVDTTYITPRNSGDWSTLPTVSQPATRLYRAPRSTALYLQSCAGHNTQASKQAHTHTAHTTWRAPRVPVFFSQCRRITSPKGYGVEKEGSPMTWQAYNVRHQHASSCFPSHFGTVLRCVRGSGTAHTAYLLTQAPRRKSKAQ